MSVTADHRGAVLVVDDDPSLRALVVSILSDAGLATLEAASGAEALACAAQAQPALVVLDVSLPGGISGYEVCRALRERYEDAISVLFVSGERTESFDRVAGLILLGNRK